ncbi:MAG: iron-containing alcohol dehydrogenase [Xanthomonadales bacterium]|nr:iron-containing alcohol dehydrogenase [Xanthomonadales bacterium]
MYLLSRIRVGILGLAGHVLNFPKPFSFVGPDASLSLVREIIGLGVKRVMVITDGQLIQLGIVNPLIELMKNSQVEVEVFSEIEPDPGYELVLKGVERLKGFKPDAVLAVGGGSSIDGAKAILLSHANNCHPSRLTGVWLYSLPRKRCLPFFAIPTTAGTGAEVTIAAVVSDKAAQIKYAIIDPKTVPAMVALDPRLMVGLPPFITAPTGMDALTHAVEAYVSTVATAETDELARMASASIMRNLILAYTDGQNLEARERMAVAASMAGLAFTRAGVGYVHAISHQLGGLYHVPHGLANAIVMPYVLEFSKPKCAHRLAELARNSDIGESGMSDAELADAFITRIRKLNSDMQIPKSIKELKREDFDKIIDRAFAEAHGTYGVPRYLTRADANALLEKLLP